MATFNYLELHVQAVADPKLLKREAGDNLLAPSSFITNTHIDL